MYLTGAQQFSVAQVPLFAGGEPVPVYVGQRFGSADDGLKCHDYQYWAPLSFLADGSIAEMQWVDSFTVEIGVPESVAARDHATSAAPLSSLMDDAEAVPPLDALTEGAAGSGAL